MTDNHNKSMKTNNQSTEPEGDQQTTGESSLDDASCSPSVSDTPETDAKRNDVAGISTAIIDMTEHAREMERQRDAARISAEHIRTSFLKLAGGHPDCIHFNWENADVEPPSERKSQ
jgi:hypothetical protein